MTPADDVDILIVGTGFAGLGMAIRLARRGHGSFLLLERAEEVGGTWRDNSYPGVACDVPSHLYSFSFRLRPDWSRLFAPGREIWRYLRDTAADEGILPHVRFGADVSQARWDDTARRWTVTTPAGTFTARVLISATGHLADEHLPDVQGLATFTGDVFHSARWNHEANLDGRRIGVVGTGASAIQIVPALAERAAELVVFQRSAPYVIPRGDRAYEEHEKVTFRRMPETMAELRSELFWTMEANYAQRRGVQPFLAMAERMAADHLAAQVPDPELRARLTPDYVLGCKRVLLSDDYYPALTRENVTLEASALARVHGTVAHAASGAAYELDTLVLATGFEATDPPFAHRVHGRGGHTLAEQWTKGMQAHASCTVHGFPNLYIINGPNTGLGHNSIVYIIEAQVDYILGALDHAAAHGIDVLETMAAAQEQYVEALQRRSEGTVWVDGGCRNWYVDPRSGRLTVVWPDFAHAFRDANAEFDPAGYVAAR